MAKSKHAHADDTIALAAYLARRIAESVPSSATYQSAIADTLAVALADAAAGRADPYAGSESHALDTD